MAAALTEQSSVFGNALADHSLHSFNPHTHAVPAPASEMMFAEAEQPRFRLSSVP